MVSTPDDPAVRELFIFEGYDHHRNIGYFVHLTRWYLDTSIWLEQIQIYLPDGDYLVRRNWGRNDPLRGPGGALLQLLCEEEGKRWRIRYRGPALRVTADELVDGPLSERPQVLVDLDLVFESAHPTWELGQPTDDHTSRRWIVEQPGRVRGRIEALGHALEIDGVGYRNHSRGPRKIATLFDHCWVHGLFPGGRAFAVFHIRMNDHAPTSGFAEAAIWDGGRVYPATCKAPPLLGDTTYPLSAPPARFTIELESERGQMRATAEVKRTLPHSTTPGGEWLDGVVSDKSLVQLVAYVRPTVFYADGEIGEGITEQSRRIE